MRCIANRPRFRFADKLSIIMALVLRPVTHWLNWLGLASAISAGLVVITVFGSLITLLYFASRPAGKWVEDAPQMSRDLHYKLSNVFKSAEAPGDMGKQVEKIAEGPKGIGVQEVVVRSPGLVTQAATGMPEALASIVLSFFLLDFFLAKVDLFLAKLVRVLPSLRDKVKAFSIAREIEAEISRYLFTVTAINCCLGLAIGVALSFTDIPSLFLWGALAALLNFIPYLGSVVGAAVVFAVSAVTSYDVVAIAAPPIIYLILTTIEGPACDAVVVRASVADESSRGLCRRSLLRVAMGCGRRRYGRSAYAHRQSDR